MSLHQKMLEEDWDGWGGVLNKPGFDQAQNKAMSVGPAAVVRTERIPPLLADSSQRKTEFCVRSAFLPVVSQDETRRDVSWTVPSCLGRTSLAVCY